MGSTTRAGLRRRFALVGLVVAVIGAVPALAPTAGAQDEEPNASCVVIFPFRGFVDVTSTQTPSPAVELGRVTIEVRARIVSPGGTVNHATATLDIPDGVVVNSVSADRGGFASATASVQGRTVELEADGPLTTTRDETVSLPTVTMQATLPEITEDRVDLEWPGLRTTARVNGATNTSCEVDAPIFTSSITNNTRPEADPQLVATDPGRSVAIRLEGRDVDRPAQRLAFNIVDPPDHGTLTGVAPNLTYTPVPGFTGDDEFDFNVHDGIGFRRATVDLLVTAVDHRPPDIALDAALPTVLGQPAPVRLAEGGTYARGQQVRAGHVCRDSGSNVAPTLFQYAASCSGQVPVNGLIDTSTVGSHTFTIESVDAAGIPARRRVSYRVLDSAPVEQRTGAIAVGGCPTPFNSTFVKVDAARQAPIAGSPTSLVIGLGSYRLSGIEIRNVEWRFPKPANARFANPTLQGLVAGTATVDAAGNLLVTRSGTMSPGVAPVVLVHMMPSVRVDLIPDGPEHDEVSELKMNRVRFDRRVVGAPSFTPLTCTPPSTALSSTTWKDTVGPLVVVTSPRHGELVWRSAELPFELDLEALFADGDFGHEALVTPEYGAPLPTGALGGRVIEVGWVDSHGNESWQTPTYVVESTARLAPP